MAAAKDALNVVRAENDASDPCKSYHEEFKEIEEVKSLIDGLKDVYDDLRSLEMSTEKFTYIIDSYQEQPHLIDPHLESLLLQLLTQVRNPETPVPVRHLAFKFLYLITKMRGYKIVVRLLPHEVSDVEPVLAMINKENHQDFLNWESRYMLLLWLSMVCMIPFDMVRLDGSSQTEAGEKKKPVMDRIIDVGKLYLSVSGKSRDAAAYMLSRFMTRPDVVKQRLPEFVDWCISIMQSQYNKSMAGRNLISGVLMTFALLFKDGKREDLLTYAPTVLKHLQEKQIITTTNTNLRKAVIKLVQRIGLTFLKNRIASWRYQRGSRSLADNLKKNKNTTAIENKATPMESDDDIDVPEEIEEVIEQLLSGLRDKDTVVRWSAAKGIGRVTGRLPKELADEVVASVLELFSLQESDGAWHGGCLSLAELGRRGLLLPERLKEVVPVVLKALSYDERRGHFSVGAHVRDAACYVCWAFARAYEPKEINPYVTKIANSLLVASIFDREVNVRRAASAAFQENVGRQGTFPHGIDILTTADYFTVGNRVFCYHELSVYIAQYPEYSRPLIDHLAQVKSAHWDVTMVQLTSKALHNLTSREPEYMAKTILPDLIAKSTGIDLYQRHGAILAVAEITLALSKIAQDQGKAVTSLIDASSVEGMKNITVKLNSSQLFRGLGGELMRKSVCHLIENLSASKMPYHGDTIIDVWQELLDDCLFHIEPEIQQAAINASPTFYQEYCRDGNGKLDVKRRDAIMNKYKKELSSSNENSRMGHSRALGAFPQFMLDGALGDMLSALIQAASLVEKEVKFAEARRDAVKAITNIVETVGVKANGSVNSCICEGNIDTVAEAYFNAMKDYTLDSRGDVGSWVREASMAGLETLTTLCMEADPKLIKPTFCERLFCCLLQQACEKIDRTREVAGTIFQRLLIHKPQIPHVPCREKLEEIFKQGTVDFLTLMMDNPHNQFLIFGKQLTREECEEVGKCAINWAAPAETFPLFVQLLDYPAYRYSVLLGISLSVGGLTESLVVPLMLGASRLIGWLDSQRYEAFALKDIRVKHSSTSLYNYLRSHNYTGEAMDKFIETVVQIFQDYQKVDRVSVPLMKMLDQMLSKGCFDAFTQQQDHPFAVKLTELVKAEISRSGDPNKLMAASDIYCGLLSFPGEIRKRVLLHLAILLCHKYPRVRKSTANKLYEALVTYDDIVPEENLDEALGLLSDTTWDNELKEVKPIRNNLCDLLKIERPKPIPKKTAESSEGGDGK